LSSFVRVGDQYVNVAHVVCARVDRSGWETTEGYVRSWTVRVELDTGRVLCHGRFDDSDRDGAVGSLTGLIAMFDHANTEHTVVPPVGGGVRETFGACEICGEDRPDWENNGPADDDEEDELSFGELSLAHAALWPRILAAVGDDDVTTARHLTERRADLATRMQALIE
jgi:hypothetical protein